MNLPNPPGGSSPFAVFLRRLLDYCTSIRLLPGLGYRLRRTSGGTILELGVATGGLPGSPVVQPRAQLLRFIEHRADIIICHSWDGTTEGTDPLRVAKPPGLRYSVVTEVILGTTYNYSAFDVDAQTRTADDGSSTLTQYITKPYFTNTDESGDCLIYAITPDYTGVEAQTIDVTSATQSGGNVDIVLSTAAVDFDTGDLVSFTGVAGLTGSLVATVSDTTHLSVPGTLSEPYVSGGHMIIPASTLLDWNVAGRQWSAPC